MNPRQPSSPPPEDKKKNWACYPITGKCVHVIPRNDEKPHYFHPQCACGVRLEKEGNSLIYVHTSWDRREVLEEITTPLE